MKAGSDGGPLAGRPSRLLKNPSSSRLLKKRADARRTQATAEAYVVYTPHKGAQRATKQMPLFQQPASLPAGAQVPDTGLKGGKLLMDRQIKEYVRRHGMVEPFSDRLNTQSVISWGLSSMGYDIRVADEYKVFTDVWNTVVDPKAFDAKSFVDHKGPACTIPPNSFALARSIEYFRIPRNVLGICLGKSSYARCGIVVNITPLEPCYDKETEILTEDGWKRFPELSGMERVATLNRKGELEYQRIIRTQKIPYRGRLITIRGRNVDLSVTPAHLLFAKKRWRDDFEFIPAGQLYGKYNYEFKRDTVWNCDHRRFFTVPRIGNRPELKIPMEDWLRFFGFWLAEGSCNWYERKGEYRVKLACFHSGRKRWMTSVLRKLPFHAIPTDTGFLLLNKQLYAYLSQFGRAPEKFIPPEIKRLPPKQLRILLDSMMLGDGNLQTLTYTTTSRRLADDFQEVIFKAGWAAIVRRIPKEVENARHHMINGHPIRHNADIYKIRISKRQLTPKVYKHSFSTVPYDDFVYDVTVPNHTLYVRRNGKPCWSSNCWEGYLTIEISNTTPLPARIYSNEGIAQVLFFASDEPCEVSYADRKGKYQKQQSIVLPKI